MTITQTVLQLAAHPLLLRLALVAAAIAFSLALYALAERPAGSRRLFGSRTDPEAAPDEPRQVIAVPYFW